VSDQLPEEVAAFVAAELDARADETTQTWWTRYLKDEATFRGVKMANTREVARVTNGRFALDDLPVERLFDVTDGLFAQPDTEDKLCATLILAEHQLERLRTIDTERLGRPLRRGLLAHWNSSAGTASRWSAPSSPPTTPNSVPVRSLRGGTPPSCGNGGPQPVPSST
jgi:hypothetical protein